MLRRCRAPFFSRLLRSHRAAASRHAYMLMLVLPFFAHCITLLHFHPCSLVRCHTLRELSLLSPSLATLSLFSFSLSSLSSLSLSLSLLSLYPILKEKFYFILFYL
ncbi:hypothetical protein Syun_009873 [Stephania yunnanensis]|uniref:Transmembrane protein n=1 Tax=Stephania yunnanensis TaxID=152371 RepID=A0AAP0KH95_9MAGN